MKRSKTAGRCVVLASVLLAAGPLAAFEVVKNVNSGKPPVEKIVVFDKAQQDEKLVLDGKGDDKFTRAADGSLVSVIAGSKEVQPVVRWKGHPMLPAAIDARQYDYLLLTCRLEGNVKQAHPNGKTTESRPDNLWFSATMINAKGERVGLASLADYTPDIKTPAETVTLKIPMMVMLRSPNDPSSIEGVGFYWGDGRATQNRDFRLVVDRIAFGNDAE